MLKSLTLKYGYKYIFKQLSRKSNVSFEFNKLNVIIGPNACGKTSLLKLIYHACENGNHTKKLDVRTSIGEDKSAAFFDKIAKAYYYNPSELLEEQSKATYYGGVDDFVDLMLYKNILSGAEKHAKYYLHFLNKHPELKDEESIVLFDEPENSNSNDTLSYFLAGLNKTLIPAPNIQLFVSTHSLYLAVELIKRGGKLIELKEGYLNQLADSYKNVIKEYELLKVKL